MLNLFFFFSIVVILSPLLFPLFLFLLSSKRELILKFFPSSTVGRMNPKTLRSLNLLCVISGLTAKPIYSKGDFTSTITQFRLGMYVVTEQNSHLPSSFHLTFQSLSVLDWTLYFTLCPFCLLLLSKAEVQAELQQVKFDWVNILITIMHLFITKLLKWKS